MASTRATRPAPKTAEQLEEEKRKFLELFHILPEKIVYEKGDAIKAEKVVAADSDYGARRLQVFNSVLTRQRTPLHLIHTRDMEFAMGLGRGDEGERGSDGRRQAWFLLALRLNRELVTCTSRDVTKALAADAVSHANEILRASR